MQIQFPTNLAAPAVARVAALLPWAVNDILRAEVVGTGEGNFTRLAIGDRLVIAQTEVVLVLGQKLDLRVASTGATTVLTVLEDAQKMQTSTVSRGLARVLPQQASPVATEQLLRSLDVLMRETRAVSTTIGSAAAANLSQHIEHLMQALPKPAQLTSPSQLRSAVEQVFVPTEARLLSALVDGSAPDMATDLRAQFTRIGIDLAALPMPARNALEQVIRQALTTQQGPESPAPPATLTNSEELAVAIEPDRNDVKTLVDAVVARLEANQLQTVANTQAEPLPVLLDLPIARDGQVDLLHMEVERDPGQNDSETLARTTVTLNLRLDGAHEFSARLQLSGDCLSLRLGASDAAFNDQITQRIGELEHGLKAAGLEVSQIFIAPLTMSSRPRLGRCQLINERV
jgi:hypothetical protein